MSQIEIDQNSDNFGFNLIEFARIIFRQKKIFLVTCFLLITAGMSYSIFERKTNPVYKGSFSLLVEDPFKKNEKNNDENFIEDIASYKTVNDIPTIIEVLKSKSLLNKALVKNNMKYEQLLNSLLITKGGNIKNVREEANGVLKISFYGRDKSKIISVLNDLSNEYISYSLKQRQDKIKEGLEFLNSQNPDVQKRMSEIQSNIENLRSSKSSINPNNQERRLDELILELDNEKKFLENQLERFLKVKKDIRNEKLFAISFQDNINLENSKSNSDNLLLKLYLPNQGILSELESLNKKLALSRTIFTPDAEVILSLERKVKSLQSLAQESQLNAVESAIYATNIKLDQINRRSNEILNKYKELPSLINKFEVLNQDLELAKENYISFTQTKEKFRLGIAQNNFPWQVINEPSVDSLPITPDLFARFNQFLFLSIIAGVGVSLLKDKIENYYHSPNEIQEKLNINIYGTIPFLDHIKNQEIYKEINNTSADKIAKMSKAELNNLRILNKRFYLHRESYRYLINNLTLFKERNDFKIINITSTIQGEGKTQTSVDLSKALNFMNKKILLIDGDLRRPKVHVRMNLRNKIGLSQIEENDVSSFSNLIQKNNKYKNLDVITSGPNLDDPFKIFNSEKFQIFLKWLYSLDNYDFIIFDSPLALFLADTNFLSNKVDYTLIVISLFKVERELVSAALKNIKLSNGKVLGVITVGTKNLDSFGYKYNYGSYRYGYEYINGLNNYENKTKKEGNKTNIFKKIKNWFIY